MFTDVQLINRGLSKLASSRITRIAPPKTPLEAYMAANYTAWKLQELTKRRWVFAIVAGYLLTYSEMLGGGQHPYKFPMPVDCLRPLRTKYSEWVQRGRYIYSAYDTLRIEYIRNAPESDFDPLFEEVLACKVAYESAEYVTQSATKKQSAKDDYDRAVTEAGKANAFIIGPEDIQADDNDFSWLTGRMYGESYG